jgi:type IV pilus assembly protein PilV
MTNRVFVFSIAPSSGFTLIEVMISVVILTVSLLGVAGMYGFAAKFAYEARQQAHAVYMVNDILEGLRMDKNFWLISVLARKDRQYQINLKSNGNASINSACPIDHASNHACRSSDFLRVEIANWQQHLDAAFSAGPASACLVLQRKNAEAIVHAKVTINWFVKNAVSSSAIPVLDAACGDTGIGRRQFIVQTLL